MDLPYRVLLQFPVPAVKSTENWIRWPNPSTKLPPERTSRPYSTRVAAASTTAPSPVIILLFLSHSLLMPLLGNFSFPSLGGGGVGGAGEEEARPPESCPGHAARPRHHRRPALFHRGGLGMYQKTSALSFFLVEFSCLDTKPNPRSWVGRCAWKYMMRARHWTYRSWTAHGGSTTPRLPMFSSSSRLPPGSPSFRSRSCSLLFSFSFSWTGGSLVLFFFPIPLGNLCRWDKFFRSLNVRIGLMEEL